MSAELDDFLAGYDTDKPDKADELIRAIDRLERTIARRNRRRPNWGLIAVLLGCVAFWAVVIWALLHSANS